MCGKQDWRAPKHRLDFWFHGRGEVLSELLGVKRRQVTVARGASSRSKVVEVEGVSALEADARLAAVLPATNRKDESEAHGE